MMKTTTTAALLLAAASAIATTAAVSAPAASASPVPACTARQLHLTLGHQRATTGHTQMTLAARNDGPACTLPGWPKLGLADARGKHLPSSVSVTGKAGGGLLLYGLTARATVSYGSDGQFGAVPAAYLTVGGKAVHVPGGITWVYAGQLSTTGWKV